MGVDGLNEYSDQSLEQSDSPFREKVWAKHRSIGHLRAPPEVANVLINIKLTTLNLQLNKNSCN